MEIDANLLMGGMFMDSDSSEQPENTYSFALNVVNEKYQGMGSEKSAISFVELLDNEYVIGHIEVNNEDVVLFTVENPFTANPTSYVLLLDKYGNLTGLLSSSPSIRPCIIDDVSFLNFKVDRQIQGTFKYFYANERLIYWTDNNNPPRTLNIDAILNGSISGYPNESDMSLFLGYVQPTLKLVQVNNTGGIDVRSGMYQFAIRYVDQNNNKTDWTGLSDIIPVILANTTNDINLIDGVDADTPTNKSISMRVFDLDTNFDTYEVAVVTTIGGTRSAFQVAEYPITSNIEDFTFTGISSTSIALSLDEVLIPTIKYQKCKTIAQKGNRLYLANLTTLKEYNYQPFANQIETKWIAKAISNPDLIACNVYKNEQDYVDQTFVENGNLDVGRSYLRDEVYAFGIVLVYVDGTESPVYHIPGRVADLYATSSIITIPSNTNTPDYNIYTPGPLDGWDTKEFNTPSNDPLGENAIVGTGLTDVPRWKLCNTAIVETEINPASIDVTNFCDGFMGYWESELTYPNNPVIWLQSDDPLQPFYSPNGLAGKPIRHHRMPSASMVPLYWNTIPIENVDYVLPENYDKAEYSIHLKPYFSNINIPDDLKPFVKEVKFVRSIREKDSQKSIMGKGIIDATYIRNGGSNEDRDWRALIVKEEGRNPFVVGGLGGFNFSQATSFGKMQVGTFIGTETFFNRPAVNNCVFLKMEQLFKGRYYDGSAALPPLNYHNAYDIINDDNNWDFNDIDLLGRRVKNVFYCGDLGIIESTVMQSNGALSNFDYNNALGGSEVVYWQIDVDHTLGFFYDKIYNYTITSGYLAYRRYYCSFHQLNPSQYGRLEDMTYVEIGKWNQDDAAHGTTFTITPPPPPPPSNYVANILTPTIVECWGGDIFVNKVNYKVKNLNSATATGVLNLDACAYSFWCESTVNSCYRQAIGDDADALYIPRNYAIGVGTDVILGVPVGTGNPNSYNLIKYNPDYSRINDVKLYYPQSASYNPLLDSSRYITRVAWSDKSFQEDSSDACRVFRAGNYYDVQKNRGEIWNLIVKDDIMFVHCENGIWRAFLEEQAQQTDATNVFLGTGDVFSLDPRELLSMPSGYGGTVSQWGGSNAPGAYFFPDLNRNAIFKLSDGLSEVSAKGMKNFSDRYFKLFLKDIVENWFMQNAPNDYATIKHLFDNPANPYGVGVNSYYDQFNERYVFTKRDFLLDSIFYTGFKGLYKAGATYANGDVVYKDNGGGYGLFMYDGVDWTTIDPTDFTDASYTVGYSVRLDNWLSFYSYYPLYRYAVNRRTFAFDNRTGYVDLWEHGGANVNNFLKVPYSYYQGNPNNEFCLVEFTSNKFPLEIKVFDAIEFDCDVMEWNNTSQSFTFNQYAASEIWAYNSYQSTDYVDLTEGVNIKRIEKLWRYNQLRDIFKVNSPTYGNAIYTDDFFPFSQRPDLRIPVQINHDPTMPWYNQSRMRDRFIKLRIKFNQDDVKNFKFLLKFIKFAFRKSYR